jgi:hypothetical protein
LRVLAVMQLQRAAVCTVLHVTTHKARPAAGAVRVCG